MTYRHLPLALILVLAASTASASTDIFLKIERDGKSVATAPVAADGSFRFDNVPDGQYYLEFQSNGRTYSTAVSPAGKSGAAGPGEPIRVATAREAASGMATGRRMHKPVTFVKEWGPSSPRLRLAVDGSTVSGAIDAAPSRVEN